MAEFIRFLGISALALTIFLGAAGGSVIFAALAYFVVTGTALVSDQIVMQALAALLMAIISFGGAYVLAHVYALVEE